MATFSRTETDYIKKLRENDQAHDRFFHRPVCAGDAAALHTFVTETYERWGRIDALVNNAGIAHDGVLALANESQIDEMISINLKAATILTKECIRFMLLNRFGNIVNISSITGQRGFSGLAVYSATKAGIEGMTRSLARELGSHGIRVNAVAPGYLDTDMSQRLTEFQHSQIISRTPLGRLGGVEDIVPFIEFLLSPASRFMTGQTLTIDGGASA